jgi:hypothetical protein
MLDPGRGDPVPGHWRSISSRIRPRRPGVLVIRRRVTGRRYDDQHPAISTGVWAWLRG